MTEKGISSSILHSLIFTDTPDVKAVCEDLAHLGISYVRFTAEGMKRLDPKDVREPIDDEKPGPQ